MARASELLTKAAREVGVTESPKGSNRVKYNTVYYGREVSGSAYPWCAAFMWWLFRECNASDLFFDGKKTAYCPTVESWGRSKGLTVDKTKGRPGDIILFDFNGKGVSGHIGIIEKVEGSYYVTIEGNTGTLSNDNGGAVMRRTRPLSVVRCIIRPKYEAEVSANKGGDVVLIELNVLKKGMKGEQVKTLQRLLRMLGFKDQHGNLLIIDGDFGGKTDAALRSFQRTEKLVVDGSCGPKTWEALLK